MTQHQGNLNHVASRILSWANENGRNPPWRNVNDAYQLALAEILLQKTKARDVEPVWRTLVLRYPTAQGLVGAPDQELIEIVRGLGLGCQRIVRLKSTAAAMLSGRIDCHLPGLGSYGTNIVRLAIGLDSLEPPIDGNISRVICRFHGLTFIKGEPRKKPEVRDAALSLNNTQESPGDKLRLIYGLIDLGAIVCRPQRPVCLSCPLVESCSYAIGLQTKMRNVPSIIAP